MISIPATSLITEIGASALGAVLGSLADQTFTLQTAPYIISNGFSIGMKSSIITRALNTQPVRDAIPNPRWLRVATVPFILTVVRCINYPNDIYLNIGSLLLHTALTLRHLSQEDPIHPQERPRDAESVPLVLPSGPTPSAGASV